jgi:hypothetical protein
MTSRRGFLAWAGLVGAGVAALLGRPAAAHHKPGHGGTTTTTSTTTTLPPGGDGVYTDPYTDPY